MRLSIKVKLFSLMSGLILLFVVLSWLMNSFLMDNYYISSKKETLIDVNKKISGIYNEDPDTVSLELEKIENTKGVRITILDSNFNLKYIYSQRPGQLPPRFPGRAGIMAGIAPHNIDMQKIQSMKPGDNIMLTGKDNRLNMNFLSLLSKQGNGDYVLLYVSVAAIQESVDIANKFFLFTGLFTIIAGSLLIFLISKRFTKPILELNDITKDMARLDFRRRYSGKSNDEIGQLGGSINSLSEQLQKSIYELKEANRKLREDIEKERRIDEMRKDFITSVSHELKTPIALIQGYAEGLKLNVNEDEENKNFYCDIITDEALKMNKLVKQLLELSQIESGVFSPEKSEFNASDLIDVVIRKSRMMLKNNNIELQYEKDGDLPVNADFDRSEQVIMNYITNAVNHVDENKILKITLQRVENKARFCVFNSGKHIPEESLDKIWSSFYKVDKARTRAYGGFGLGLSIVRAIQEAQQNAYGVENVQGGVTFWFELDLAS